VTNSISIRLKKEITITTFKPIKEIYGIGLAALFRLDLLDLTDHGGLNLSFLVFLSP